jgi:hypothetical protein
MKPSAFLSIACACACLSAAGGLRAADFRLDFLDCPQAVRGSPGETKRVRV